jgi:hypothetical protein
MLSTMGKLRALVVAAIILLAAVSLLLVYRATEPSASDAASGARPAPTEVSTGAQPGSPAQDGAPPLPGHAVVAPAAGGAGSDVKVGNESPPIQGPIPLGLPTDPVEREAAVVEVRKQRVSDQMERLNRRNQKRGGIPAPQPPPSAPGQPAP